MLTVGILVCGASAFLVFIERATLKTAWASRRWIRVRGRILCAKDSSVILTETYAMKYGISEFRYEFFVNSKRYEGATYCFGGLIDQISAQYRVGDFVNVYYNPLNPDQCVLRNGLTFSLVLPVVLFFVGIFWIYIAWMPNKY